jgi:hypothetical protein
VQLFGSMINQIYKGYPQKVTKLMHFRKKISFGCNKAKELLRKLQPDRKSAKLFSHLCSDSGGSFRGAVHLLQPPQYLAAYWFYGQTSSFLWQPGNQK